MHRFKYIDALRGIAIMLVILHHSHPYFAGINNYKLPDFFNTILQNGDKGVTLFFMLSAYTLCLSLGRKKDTETRPLRNYFLRRVFRIVPLYYFAILVILVLGINSPSLSSIMANIFFVHGLNPYWVNSTVPGGWSVGIEVLFYLIFPFIFFRAKSPHRIVNITLICMLIAKVVTSIMSKYIHISDGVLMGVFTYENIFSQLPVFLIGMSLYFITHQTKGDNQSPRSYITYCFLAGMIILHLLGGNVFKDHYLFALAFAFLAFGLSKYPVTALVNKFTIFIGKLSYSIYLVHLIVLNLLFKYHFTNYSTNASAEVFIRFAIVLSISTGISILTYHFIEVPFQEYGKRIISKLELKSGKIRAKSPTA